MFAGVLCTGMAATIQASPKLAFVGVALGFLLVVLSFVFWKLDQRTAFLIKHSEEVLKQLEPVNAPLMGGEELKTAATQKGPLAMWTYGQAFRAIFATMALVGVAGATLGGLRGFGLLEFGVAKAATVPEATLPGVTRPAAPSLPSASGSHYTVRKPTLPCDMRRSNPTG